MGCSVRPVFYILLVVAIVVFSTTTLLRASENSYFSQAPTVEHINNTTIKVSWNSYPDANETTHYQVLADAKYYGSSTKLLHETVKYLNPGGDFEVKVVTFHNGRLLGVSSATQVLMTPLAVSNIKVFDVTTNSFGIMWSGVETATKYNFYNNNTLIGSKEESGINNKLTLNGFEDGALLNITMTAVNKTGESPSSDVIPVQLFPVASLSLKIVDRDITSTSFKVKWTPVKYASSYKILINEEEIASVSSDITEYTVKDLMAGTSVSVKIAVANSAGQAVNDESVIVQLKPSTPILTATDISSYSVTLTWSVSNGANNYKVFVNGENAIYNVPSTITNLTVTDGVNEGMTATYTVRGVNDIGESEDSNAVTVTFATGSVEVNSPIDMNTLRANCFQFTNTTLPAKYRGKSSVWVYFPPELTGPKLALEAEYLEFLASSEELASVDFYGVLTNSSLKNKNKLANLKWKLSKAAELKKIKGKVPIVRFYSESGELRGTINISMAIITNMDIYKALPELMEKNESVTHLYSEFEKLHER